MLIINFQTKPMNDLRAVIPPGFSERASSTNFAKAYNLNIPLMYSNKNPSWQQLTINEADVLEPDVVMQRLNQDEIFAPDAEDVALLEREVNIYRSRMRDDELEALQEQRRLLMQQLQDGNMDDDLDDQLRNLDARIRARQLELDEMERRRREIEEENRRLEEELNRRAPVIQKIVSSAPPPPQPRSRSPNILPPKIANLPVQRENRVAYNYKNTEDPLYLSGVLSDDKFYEASHSPAQPPRQQQPPATFAPPQMMTPSSPPPPRGFMQPTQQMMMSSPPPLPLLANPAPMNSPMQPMMGVVPTIPMSPVNGQGTYKIGGVNYTDATLPPQYAYLRR
jgi:hypothetical protein